MSQQYQVITKKQARKQINHFGRALILYVLTISFLQYGTDAFQERFSSYFGTLDMDYVILALTYILVLVCGLGAFAIAGHALQLPIRDYLKKPKLRLARLLVLTSQCIAVYLIALSISSLFCSVLHINGPTYSYLGTYNSRAGLIKNVLYFIAYVLLVPAVEEYIFRGIIQRQLGHYSRYFGVLASAFLYAIAQPSLAEAIPAFFAGWYLAHETLRYHSIRPGIFMHIGLNLILWCLDNFSDRYLLLLTIVIVVIYILTGLSVFSGGRRTSLAVLTHTDRYLWKILLSTASIVICLILFACNLYLSAQ